MRRSRCRWTPARPARAGSRWRVWARPPCRLRRASAGPPARRAVAWWIRRLPRAPACAGKRTGSARKTVSLSESLSGFHVEDDAAQNFTGLQVFKGGICLARRPCFDRRGLELLFFRQGYHFLKFLQVADIRADDPDGPLRDRWQRMGKLAAVEPADDVAPAFSQAPD